MHGCTHRHNPCPRDAEDWRAVWACHTLHQRWHGNGLGHGKDVMPLLQLLMVTLVAGLTNGNQVTLQDPQFTGFIETRNDGQAFLLYRTDKLHGELPTASIARIDFGYSRGLPFLLT